MGRREGGRATYRKKTTALCVNASGALMDERDSVLLSGAGTMLVPRVIARAARLGVSERLLEMGLSQ